MYTFRCFCETLILLIVDMFHVYLQHVNENFCNCEWVIVVQHQLSNFQVYHGKNKLIFNEMMMRSTLY